MRGHLQQARHTPLSSALIWCGAQAASRLFESDTCIYMCSFNSPLLPRISPQQAHALLHTLRRFLHALHLFLLATFARAPAPRNLKLRSTPPSGCVPRTNSKGVKCGISVRVVFVYTNDRSEMASVQAPRCSLNVSLCAMRHAKHTVQSTLVHRLDSWISPAGRRVWSDFEAIPEVVCAEDSHLVSGTLRPDELGCMICDSSEQKNTAAELCITLQIVLKHRSGWSQAKIMASTSGVELMSSSAHSGHFD